ncbi:DUF3619 family protein [Massilia sp. W12]|uniref:DUF3619 family protein n=1 Tax=Massilia sp. W12 TaxID=3126507 RepID=UPI0030CFCCBD
MNTQQEFNAVLRVRQALNDGLEAMPQAKLDRLAQARRAALARKKPDSPLTITVRRQALAGGVQSAFDDSISWLRRMGLALPLVALALGLTVLWQVEEQQHISEIAEIDAEVLADELPPSAYLDHGFNAYLAKRGE